MTYLFVGERRSKTAIKMGVEWKDGRLAAKQLFDALVSCRVCCGDQQFINVFRPNGQIDQASIARIKSSQVPVVAMGKKVQQALAKHEIGFIPIVHPAARGSIRRKDRYIDHIRSALFTQQIAN